MLFRTNDSELISKGEPHALPDLHDFWIGDLQGELGNVVAVALLTNPDGLVCGQPVGEVGFKREGALVKAETFVSLLVVDTAQLVEPVGLDS